MKLREVLSDHVVTVPTYVTVAEGAAAMQQAGIGSLAVVEMDEFYGIFTERDVVRCVAAGDSAIDATVGAWMTPYPDSFAPDLSVGDAADWMVAVGYRHLPVVERGKLVGMVSIKDILRALTGEPAA